MPHTGRLRIVALSLGVLAWALAGPAAAQKTQEKTQQKTPNQLQKGGIKPVLQHGSSRELLGQALLNKGVTGTVKLTPQVPYAAGQAMLQLNAAGFYDTQHNKVRLETQAGGSGSYVELRYLPAQPGDTHVVEFEVSSRKAGTWRAWGHGQHQQQVAAGRQTIQVALPPAGSSGWKKVLLGPTFTTGWTLHAASVSATR